MENLGYRNGWPGHYEDGNGNVVDKSIAKVWKDEEPKELTACRALGHKPEGTHTRDGQHHSWCSICQIEWFLDSGD